MQEGLRITKHTEEEPTTTLSNAEALSLVTQLWGSYKGLAGSTFKLLLADTKLAALSLVQLFLLIVLSTIVIFCIWACMLILFILVLKSIGLSLTGAIISVLIVNIVLLISLLLACRSTARGLTLEASKSVLTSQTKNPANENQLSTSTKTSG